ncbi:hypothetical protein B0H12DRAFT_1230946 [Mycena haematopus]|nr:hypothetical protein B0H12DRAFT_1230946 [Mycena haematopus]
MRIRSPNLSAHSDSESDNDDAPIAVPHTQAKRAVRTRDAAREQIVAKERGRQKEKNRERDRRLKERAGGEKGKKGDDEEEGVESRMERAMREAAQEEGEDEDDDSEISGEQDLEEYSDSDEDDEDDEQSTNPNHLPDHLFTSAFASASAPSSKKSLREPKPAKRKRTRTPKAKDIVVGSRTIRVTSTIPRPIPATLPSRKIRKFTDHALALKSGGVRSRNAKTWSRMPANLGVMRRALHGPPAVGFVRNP